MTQAITTETVQMCDLVPDKPAIAKYRWDWGETGFCSSEGQFLLNQQAKNLKRHVAYLPLENVKQPLARDERTRLIAEKLSAESEREETARRCSKLYDQTVELSEQLNREKVLNLELTAQKTDLTDQVRTLESEVSRLSANNGQLIVDLQRAKATGTDSQLQALRDELDSTRASLERAASREIELTHKASELSDREAELESHVALLQAFAIDAAAKVDDPELGARLESLKLRTDSIVE